MDAGKEKKSSEFHYHLYSWVIACVFMLFLLVLLLVIKMVFFQDIAYTINPGVTYTATPK